MIAGRYTERLFAVFVAIIFLYDANRRITNRMEIRNVLNEVKQEISLDEERERLKAETSLLGKNVTTKKKNKVILFWVPFYGVPFYGFGRGSEPFADYKCPVRNCETTNDRNRLLEADAVVFHYRDIRKQGRVTSSLLPGFDMPTAKPSNQRWVFFLKEAVPYTGYNLMPFRGWFNWTMTYLKESDFYAPYGKTHRKEKKDTQPLDRNSFIKPKGQTLVAWIVSHCNTPSKREDYAKKLGEHLTVHIYGYCGNMQCSNKSGRECLTNVSRKYKFFLSFENSLCEDYVTEKLWEVLALTNLVPIVYGAANYTRDAPPHSFIDARSYTPEKLAEYLKLLDENDDLYMKYHEWRREYYVSLSHDGKSKPAFCDLCAALNEEKMAPKWIDDIQGFWRKRCEEDISVPFWELF